MNLDPINAVNIDAHNQRALLVRQLRCWGDLNTDAILDPLCKQFYTPSIDGFIGYRIEMQCAIVFGDPVCAIEDQKKLLTAFENYCLAQNLNIVYVIISEKCAQSLVSFEKKMLIQFGNKLILDPHNDPAKKTGSKAILIRKKIKRALNSGMTAHEYQNNNPAIEHEIEQVGHSWLQARNGPQVYIAHLSFFNDREGKRWFYATRDGRVIGFLILNAVQSCKGWLLDNLILTPEAPPGTSELLITTTMNTLKQENCHSVIIGPVVGTDIKIITGVGKNASWLANALFKMAKKIFRLDGQRVFWEKFSPQTEPSYIVFDKLNVRTIKGLMNAMNVKFYNR